MKTAEEYLLWYIKVLGWLTDMKKSKKSTIGLKKFKENEETSRLLKNEKARQRYKARAKEKKIMQNKSTIDTNIQLAISETKRKAEAKRANEVKLTAYKDFFDLVKRTCNQNPHMSDSEKMEAIKILVKIF